MTAPGTTADPLVSPLVSPVVSVVVIVYNDAARLPTAVASALAQQVPLEVVVVDDASTDATPQVCADLAADPRVRVIRRDTNSGGCSAPRNDGIEVARGRWVFFLDSDDVLPPGALPALVEAGEAAGADLASGLCQRVYQDSGAVRPWCPELYSRPRVLAGLDDEPELFRDSLSTNKAYRRDFLEAHALRFPLGMHFEDLVFSARAYLSATKIALVPDPVYRWNVAAEDTGELSISRRRHTLANLADRVRAHQLIDDALAASRPGDEKLRAAKDRKFVEADLRLYLDDLWLRDDDYRAGFLELLVPYLAQLPPASWDAIPPLPRLAAEAVHDGDLARAQDVTERLRRADRRRLPWLARLDTIDLPDTPAERRCVASVVLVPDPLSPPGRPPLSLSAELVPVLGGVALSVGRRLLQAKATAQPGAGETAGRWELEVSPPPAAFGSLPVAWRIVVSGNEGQPLPSQTLARPHRWDDRWSEPRSRDDSWWWDVSRGGDVQLVTARAARLERRVEGLRRRWRWTPLGRALLRATRRV